MAINFPNSPTVGQTAVFNGVTYTWSGSFWDSSSISGNIAFNLTSISAAGTTQATATLITSDLVLVGTVAVNSGVRFPTDFVGRRIVIRNSGINDLRVYPSTGAQINELGTNVAFILGTATTLEFVGFSSTQWYTTNATFA
jgi:hypothetical protein